MVISPNCLTAGRPSCVIRKALMHGIFIKWSIMWEIRDKIFYFISIGKGLV